MFGQNENDGVQTVNKIEANNGEEYNKRVEEEANKLGQQNDTEQDQLNTDLRQSLTRSGQLHNQPNIEVTSRVVEGVDETFIAKHINNDGIQDGKAVMRTLEMIAV
ncbi:unnamed protein product [Parnassius apollo]|uniref:(apollo) hypothetical protein n=1 Tax=Parnassius apollo TaxID=110799 RepID=A0A8S3YCV6_PARAO|nr:unnamed protein product [Parnassius apollo]